MRAIPILPGAGLDQQFHVQLGGRAHAVDPWLDETQRFRDLPVFASLERRLGLTGMADEARD